MEVPENQEGEFDQSGRPADPHFRDREGQGSTHDRRCDQDDERAVEPAVQTMTAVNTAPENRVDRNENVTRQGIADTRSTKSSALNARMEVGEFTARRRGGAVPSA